MGLVFSMCILWVFTAFLLAVFVLYSFSDGVLPEKSFWIRSSATAHVNDRKNMFLEIPQIAWGLNNQKIAFARACLTARMLNRILLMPNFSASLFYKELELLDPMPFDKIFNFKKFNHLCNGYVRLGHFSDVSNFSDSVDLHKGSGRKWTAEKDVGQLEEFSRYPMNDFEVIRIVAKNPFLWHDHWPLRDYAKIFSCLVLVDEISAEATKVFSRIKDVGRQLKLNALSGQRDNYASLSINTTFVAVHMRIEEDWMIHCKKLEQKSNISQICSSKKEIVYRTAHIHDLQKPAVIYLAVADSLLKDPTILEGWGTGLLPYEKKKLGVWEIYDKYPYIIKSAIDYEVCLRSDIFVGNSFSTFSSLVVLERTQKSVTLGANGSHIKAGRWKSYAYNIPGKFDGPCKWVTDMSAPSLQSISYGSNNISC